MTDVVPSWRAVRMWQRNATTYRRVWVASFLGHLADPLFYLAVLGVGLGRLMPPIDGEPYIRFLVTGLPAGAAMLSACFEGGYGSFLRMRDQRTYDAVLATPLSVADLGGGEVLWAATKGLISAVATLLIALAFGLLSSAWSLVMLPVVVLQGMFFGGVALAAAARMSTLDGMNHFYALFMMPVLFLSGVFFPLDQLPPALVWLALISPLTHAVHLARPLALGEIPIGWGQELLIVALAGAFGVWLGIVSLRRRMVV